MEEDRNRERTKTRRWRCGRGNQNSLLQFSLGLTMVGPRDYVHLGRKAQKDSKQDRISGASPPVSGEGLE